MYGDKTFIALIFEDGSVFHRKYIGKNIHRLFARPGVAKRNYPQWLLIFGATIR